MMNRRVLFWLVKAYVQKWGKRVIIFFFIGLAIFFCLIYLFQYLTAKVLLTSKKTIGVVGAYTVDTLPPYILQDLSQGLTIVDLSAQAKPNLATSWAVTNSGKTYTFRLKNGVSFSDGTALESEDINFNFRDVKVIKPDKKIIQFTLKEPFAPFLARLSQPIFKDNFIGIGTFKIRDIKLNGTFIESLTLINIKDSRIQKIYQFYPTQDALKIAFMLGEVSTIRGLTDLSFKNTAFNAFPNTIRTQDIDHTQMVAIFYNHEDSNLSDKRLREALAYALPNTFLEGKRARSPLSPFSFAYQEDKTHQQDIEHAKLLLEASKFDVTITKKSPFVIKTLPKYKKTAEEVMSQWQKLGIHTKVEIVTELPSSFQMYISNFNLPKDPDQYTLWHSFEQNNISNYKNLRIDKLLEDGRKTLDQEERIQIYAEFQKYFFDDPPASPLYFPFSYTVVRK